MDIVILIVLILGSTVSSVSFFVIRYTSRTSVNGEVEQLNGIDLGIDIMKNHVSNCNQKNRENSKKAIA